MIWGRVVWKREEKGGMEAGGERVAGRGGGRGWLRRVVGKGYTYKAAQLSEDGGIEILKKSRRLPELSLLDFGECVP